MSEAAFWGLTLREFGALTDRVNDNHEWLNYRTGLICAVLANTVRDPKKKVGPYTPEDFMPKVKSKQQTAEQMFANIKLLNAAFGGKVLES